MSENKREPSSKMAIDVIGIGGYRVPADYPSDRLDVATYFYSDGWHSLTPRDYLPIKKLINHFTVIAVSGTTFGIGIGKLIANMMGH